jgi:hypothetical protein
MLAAMKGNKEDAVSGKQIRFPRQGLEYISLRQLGIGPGLFNHDCRAEQGVGNSTLFILLHKAEIRVLWFGT